MKKQLYCNVTEISSRAVSGSSEERILEALEGLFELCIVWMETRIVHEYPPPPESTVAEWQE